MSEVHGRTIGTDLGFTEGPVIRQGGDYVFVSCDRGRVYRIDGEELSVFAETGGGPNGLAEGADGSIYVSQNGRGVPPYAGPRPRDFTGGVQVIPPEGGSVSWVTQDPVSPNDLCFGPDGLLYVTDPTRPMARHNGRIWSVNVETGDTEILTQLDWYPNGIGFGLDPTVLFVVNSSHHTIVRFSLNDGKLGAPDPFIDLKEFSSDGFDFDVDGNLVMVTGAGHIETWTVDGKLLDVAVVEQDGHGFANIALDENRVLIGTSPRNGSVVKYDEWPSAGLPLHPFRK